MCEVFFYTAIPPSIEDLRLTCRGYVANRVKKVARFVKERIEPISDVYSFVVFFSVPLLYLLILRPRPVKIFEDRFVAVVRKGESETKGTDRNLGGLEVCETRGTSVDLGRPLTPGDNKILCAE